MESLLDALLLLLSEDSECDPLRTSRRSHSFVKS
jgi:hypothetical protein